MRVSAYEFVYDVMPFVWNYLYSEIVGCRFGLGREKLKIWNVDLDHAEVERRGSVDKRLEWNETVMKDEIGGARWTRLQAIQGWFSSTSEAPSVIRNLNFKIKLWLRLGLEKQKEKIDFRLPEFGSWIIHRVVIDFILKKKNYTDITHFFNRKKYIFKKCFNIYSHIHIHL